MDEHEICSYLNDIAPYPEAWHLMMGFIPWSELLNLFAVNDSHGVKSDSWRQGT